VTLIDRGKIIATESPRTLGHMLSRYQRIDVEGASELLLDEIRVLRGVSGVTTDGAATRIEVDEEGVTQLVLERLIQGGVASVRTSLPSLEEVYVHLIGERGMEI